MESSHALSGLEKGLEIQQTCSLCINTYAILMKIYSYLAPWLNINLQIQAFANTVHILNRSSLELSRRIIKIQVFSCTLSNLSQILLYIGRIFFLYVITLFSLLLILFYHMLLCTFKMIILSTTPLPQGQKSVQCISRF